MTARTGLATMITTIRGMCNAGTADFSSGGATYWTDDQIQTVFDRHRLQLNNHNAQAVMKMASGGVAEWHDYYVGYANLESGTAVFAVEDGLGNAYGTALWSADYARGVVTFPADNKGAVVTITGQAYDLNAIAADIWGQKAAAYAAGFDFSTDNHSIKRSQVIDNAFKMASWYEAKVAPTNNTFDRNDIVSSDTPGATPNRHHQLFGNQPEDY